MFSASRMPIAMRTSLAGTPGSPRGSACAFASCFFSTISAWRLGEDRRLLEREPHPEADEDQHGARAGTGSASPRPRTRRRSAPRPAPTARRSRAGCPSRRRPAATRTRSRAGRRSPCSAAISTAPPHSPPTAKPCSSRQASSRIGAATPIVAYVGSRPIAKVAEAHHQQRDDQHLLAADPVTEVTEDHAAERAGDEPERVGAEGQRVRGHRVAISGKNSLPKTRAAAEP